MPRHVFLVDHVKPSNMTTPLVHGGTAPLAALTTIFEAPTPCSRTYILTSSKAPSQFPPFPTDGPASCVPPAWVENLSGKGFQFYSPAVCPQGNDVRFLLASSIFLLTVRSRVRRGRGLQVEQDADVRGFPGSRLDRVGGLLRTRWLHGKGPTGCLVFSEAAKG